MPHPIRDGVCVITEGGYEVDQQNILKKLPQTLLPWYDRNKRQLPWREDREPYHIWLSEIMLQQTRVEAVKGYYKRFLENLPTVEALAKSDDEQLHKLWEGLGYYSRVRNLKKAAQVIMEKHGGQFPAEYEQVLALPGIGAYTAGAICSIAFNQKTPAVDGNVLRVFTRLLNDPEPIDTPAMKQRVSEQLQQIYPEQAGAFTQALMELGATVCGPNRKPDCKNCPCSSFCVGYREGTAQQLPVKSPKKGRRQADLTVFVLCCDGSYALEKRGSAGLLADLWQFPNTPGHLTEREAVAWLQEKGITVTDVFRQCEKTHIFTHVQWNMRGYYLQVKAHSGEYTWLTEQEICQQYALPTAFRMFWEERGVFA